jgi:hypothetical protein
MTHHHRGIATTTPHREKKENKEKGTYFNDRISAASRLFMRGSNPPL